MLKIDLTREIFLKFMKVKETITIHQITLKKILNLFTLKETLKTSRMGL